MPHYGRLNQSVNVSGNYIAAGSYLTQDQYGQIVSGFPQGYKMVTHTMSPTATVKLNYGESEEQKKLNRRVSLKTIQLISDIKVRMNSAGDYCGTIKIKVGAIEKGFCTKWKSTEIEAIRDITQEIEQFLKHYPSKVESACVT